MKYQIFNTKTPTPDGLGTFEGNHEIINPGIGDEFNLEKVRNTNGQSELIRYKIVGIEGIIIKVRDINIM